MDEVIFIIGEAVFFTSGKTDVNFIFGEAAGGGSEVQGKY